MDCLVRIFADFNNTDEKGRIRLTSGSFNDIHEQKVELRDGLQVLLDDNDELTAIGILEFSKEETVWVAKIDRDKIDEKGTRNSE
jgi:hypothetical protein